MDVPFEPGPPGPGKEPAPLPFDPGGAGDSKIDSPISLSGIFFIAALDARGISPPIVHT